MLGIIVQLAISWIIVWLIERNNLRVLGFFPTKKRLLDFLLHFLLTAVCCSSAFLIRIFYLNQSWEVNPGLNWQLVYDGLAWNVKSVLYEELMFRGVIFYILIRKLGIGKAIIISAVAFGIYHWFSFGVIGNIGAMAFTFFITGLMGLLLAYGYSKTFSLYIPCAIHLGWNFTQTFVFSQGPIGDGIFKQVNPEPFRTTSYIVFFIAFLLPVVSALLLNFLLLKRKKQVDPAIYERKNRTKSLEVQ